MGPYWKQKENILNLEEIHFEFMDYFFFSYAEVTQD